MPRNIYCRRRGRRIQVYSAEYNANRKRGIQKGLGSLDYIDATSQHTDIDHAIERAANEKLVQSLDPTEWQPIREWIAAERDRIKRNRAAYEAQFAPDRLNEIAAAFEATRDIEDVKLPDGEAAHAALDRLRKAMKRAGVQRPPRTGNTTQKAPQKPQDPSQMSWLENTDGKQTGSRSPES